MIFFGVLINATAPPVSACLIPVEYIPYTADHLVTQLQLLLFAGFTFFVMLPLMTPTDGL